MMLQALFIAGIIGGIAFRSVFTSPGRAWIAAGFPIAGGILSAAFC